MADDKPSPRRGRKPPEGGKRQVLTTMDPDVIRAIKQVALHLDRTASDVTEEAAKQWLARHKHKKIAEDGLQRRAALKVSPNAPLRSRLIHQVR